MILFANWNDWNANWATFDRLGGLDILINSVGGSSAPGGGVLALTDDIWQKEFELNLFSALMEHCFTVAGDKIAALSCRLADGDPID